MRHKRIKNFIVGGALISALFITKASAYDAISTHPALTDEIVDFYNLNFSQKLSDQDKSWLIKGSTDEDQGIRPMNHFYDPVHNIGMAGFSTSKQWAMSSGAQSNLAMANKSIAQSAGVIKSADDFSYERAMDDYAQGDRQRAMIGFGHLLHLLEDAGVPDHTRNDAHPPVSNLGSPYEHEMAKWNPDDFNIVSELKKEGLKPVVLANLSGYFDNLAKYSNGNFFSKDTISNTDYKLPKMSVVRKVSLNGVDRAFIVNNRSGTEFPIAFVQENSGKITNSIYTLEIGSYILDGYWDRLSKEVVLNGAGALNLLLTEAEKAKTEYATNRPPEKNWFAKLLGLIGIEIGQLTTSDGEATSDVSKVSGDTMVTPTPKVTNPSVSPTPLVTKTPVTNVTMVSPTPSPSKTPIPTPKPKPSITPTPSPSATPKTLTVKNSGLVVINEIAWAGTSASATDEWIELYNTENNPIDVSSWQLVSSDESPDIIFPEGTILQANSYFLIERTDDNTISDMTADLAVGFGQGGLNNAGEMVRLFDSAGTIVDMVGGAGETWYFGDSSLKNSMERIDPTKAGNNASNWKSFSGTPVSKDANGNNINGTPKVKNSTVLVAVVVSGGGGSSSTPTPTPLPTPTPSPTPDPSSPLLEVVINEIAWMGTATSSNDEWMELYNTTNQTIDLTGWTLKATDGTPNITLSASIEPFGLYLLERTPNDVIIDISADKTYTGALSNSGEYFELKNSSGNLEDFVDNSSGWYGGTASPGYKSMERIDPKKSGDDATNWATNDGTNRNGLDAAGQPINGTPRAPNSVYVSLKPSVVTNLAVTGSFGQFSLTWSAPSDLDTLPANLSYDLRYATTSFAVIDDWNTAHKLASVSLPAVAEGGAPESASFNIPNSYNQKWYFALKTKDQTGVSDISNIPDKTTESAISDSWSMFGKDQYHTSFATNLTGPGVGATISWEFAIGAGKYIGQPVISGEDDVYFGSSDGKFYSLDKNGSENRQSYAGSSGKSDGPVVFADGTTYFGHNMSGSSDITALNPDGSQKWIYYTNGTGPLTLAGDGSVYFSSWDNKLNVLKPDGSLKWQVNGSFGSFSPIILASGNVINVARVSGTPHFYSYSSLGNQVWDTSFALGYDYLPSNPSFDSNTDKINSAVGHYLVQLSEIGELTKTLIDSNGVSTTMVAISPADFLVGLDFTNFNPASGSQIIALDKSTKEIKWRYHVDSRINNQIVIDKDGSVYFSTRNGKLYGLDSSGGLMWTIDVATTTDISPVLTENGLIWGYGNRLTSIGVK
jgi:hypothetical protein